MKVIMVSDNADLSERLKEGFDEFYSDKVQFEIKTYSDGEYIKSADFDLMIADFSKVNLKNDDMIEAAYAVMSCDSEKNPDFPSVEMYQNVHDMYKSFTAITEKYKSGELHYKKLFKIRKTEISVFFSCNGGAGASTISEAYFLSKKKDSKSCHISLEPFSEAEESGKLMPEKIFSADSSNEKYDLLEFAPIEHIENIKNFSMKKFLDYMENRDEFTYISIDADFSYTEILPEILGCADKIWFIISKNGCDRKLERMKRYAEYISNGSMKKAGVIYNRADKLKVPDDAFSVKEIDGKNCTDIIGEISRIINI